MATYRSHTATSFTATDTFLVTKPSGTASGDQLLAFVAWRPPSVDTYGTMTPPSGWTLMHEQAANSGGRFKLYVYQKVAGGSEPSDYTWTSDISSGTRQMRIYIGAYQSVASGYEIADSAIQLNNTDDSTAEAPDVTADSTPALQVSFHVHGDGVTTGYFGTTASVSAGTIQGQYVDDANGGRLVMVLSDYGVTGTGTKTGITSTTSYGTSDSQGVTVLLRDSSYSPVTYKSYLMMRGM